MLSVSRKKKKNIILNVIDNKKKSYPPISVTRSNQGNTKLKVEGESPMATAKRLFEEKYGYKMTPSVKRDLLNSIYHPELNYYNRMLKESGYNQ